MKNCFPPSDNLLKNIKLLFIKTSTVHSIFTYYTFTYFNSFANTVAQWTEALSMQALKNKKLKDWLYSQDTLQRQKTHKNTNMALKSNNQVRAENQVKLAPRAAKGLQVTWCDLKIRKNCCKTFICPRKGAELLLPPARPLLISTGKEVCSDGMKMATATQLYSRSTAEPSSAEQENALQRMGSIPESSPESLQHTAPQDSHQTSQQQLKLATAT